MGLKQRYGSVGQGVARGLRLRMDNGSQYLSEHFQNQIKFWGIAPSFAFVAQPETNGAVERFNNTLKELIVHGRHYRNAEELRAAVGAFVETYNRHWLLEKLGVKSPWQARQEFDGLLSRHDSAHIRLRRKQGLVNPEGGGHPLAVGLQRLGG